jgi:hypothetical protein
MKNIFTAPYMPIAQHKLLTILILFTVLFLMIVPSRYREYIEISQENFTSNFTSVQYKYLNSNPESKSFNSKLNSIIVNLKGLEYINILGRDANLNNSNSKEAPHIIQSLQDNKTKIYNSNYERYVFFINLFILYFFSVFFLIIIYILIRDCISFTIKQKKYFMVSSFCFFFSYVYHFSIGLPGYFDGDYYHISHHAMLNVLDEHFTIYFTSYLSTLYSFFSISEVFIIHSSFSLLSIVFFLQRCIKISKTYLPILICVILISLNSQLIISHLCLGRDSLFSSLLLINVGSFLYNYLNNGKYKRKTISFCFYLSLVLISLIRREALSYTLVISIFLYIYNFESTKKVLLTLLLLITPFIAIQSQQSENDEQFHKLLSSMAHPIGFMYKNNSHLIIPEIFTKYYNLKTLAEYQCSTDKAYYAGAINRKALSVSSLIDYREFRYELGKFILNNPLSFLKSKKCNIFSSREVELIMNRDENTTKVFNINKTMIIDHFHLERPNVLFKYKESIVDIFNNKLLVYISSLIFLFYALLLKKTVLIAISSAILLRLIAMTLLTNVFWFSYYQFNILCVYFIITYFCIQTGLFIQTFFFKNKTNIK